MIILFAGSHQDGAGPFQVGGVDLLLGLGLAGKLGLATRRLPSVDGISHAARELTRWEHCTRGADVLLQTVLSLA